MFPQTFCFATWFLQLYVCIHASVLTLCFCRPQWVLSRLEDARESLAKWPVKAVVCLYAAFAVCHLTIYPQCNGHPLNTVMTVRFRITLYFSVLTRCQSSVCPIPNLQNSFPYDVLYNVPRTMCKSDVSHTKLRCFINVLIKTNTLYVH